MEPDGGCIARVDTARRDEQDAVRHEDQLNRQIRTLYEHVGLSARRIAAALGIGRRHVDRALREGGVEVAPRGAGRPRPSMRRADPNDLEAQLRALYIDEGLTRRPVSEKLGMTEVLSVRAWHSLEYPRARGVL